MKRMQAYLAGQNIPEGWEGIIQGLVVNRLVHVLDEDVTHARLPKSGVTLRPHYSDRPTLDNIVVHCIQGTLRLNNRKIGFKKNTTSHCQESILVKTINLYLLRFQYVSFSTTVLYNAELSDSSMEDWTSALSWVQCVLFHILSKCMPD